MHDPNAPAAPGGGPGRPPRPAEEELGIGLTDLLEADVTLVVGGKDKDPKLELEIELKSGRKVKRPLPEPFVDPKTRRVRIKELAAWLYLNEATLVDALTTSNAQAAQFVDRERLAEQLGVGDEDPLSSMPVTLKKGRRSGWTFQLKAPWVGLTRLPLGKVTALADDEKIGDVPGGPAAEPISDDRRDQPFGAADVLPLDERDQDLLQRGCLGWVVDHKALAALGLAGAFLLLVLVVVIVGGDDDGSGSGSGSTGDATASQSNTGPESLPVGQYADRACGIFADNLVDPGNRFRAALDTATAASVATPELYAEIVAAGDAFATGLRATADALEDTPAPDVDGGPAAHRATIADYRAAATAVGAVVAAAAGYDVATATQAQTVALGEEVNRALAELDEALGPGPDDVAEIDAAFEASDDCRALAA
jgi:hypothetical protein